MKVAFYINNSQFPNVDCRNVTEGNPGIGGTWHIFLIVSSQLAIRDNNIDVTTYAQHEGLLPKGPNYKYVKDQEQAIFEADSDGSDYIVISYGGFDWKGFDYTRLKSKLKIIVWCHNFCALEDLSLFSHESKIAKLITVGREQMDLYRDFPVFDKTDYIYNCVPFPRRIKEKALNSPYYKRNHRVVYLASLVPAKSFHILAEVWPVILKKIPDAELFVIGSGRTYFKDAQLGSYGIASRDYEPRFMAPLLNPKGELLPSVHFLGNLGCEKYEYINKAKVGVPNPTGSTETFCISAVEMQYLGCSVTAMRAPGYYDTFLNGIITKRSKKAFAKTLIKLLKSEVPVVSYSETVEGLQNKFSIETVVQEWETLLNGDIRDHLHPVNPVHNKLYRMKWLKELKRQFGFTNIIPPVEALLEIRDSVMKRLFGF